MRILRRAARGASRLWGHLFSFHRPLLLARRIRQRHCHPPLRRSRPRPYKRHSLLGLWSFFSCMSSRHADNSPGEQRACPSALPEPINHLKPHMAMPYSIYRRPRNGQRNLPPISNAKGQTGEPPMRNGQMRTAKREVRQNSISACTPEFNCINLSSAANKVEEQRLFMVCRKFNVCSEQSVFSYLKAAPPPQPLARQGSERHR